MFSQIIEKFIDWFCTKFNYYPYNTYVYISNLKNERDDLKCDNSNLCTNISDMHDDAIKLLNRCDMAERDVQMLTSKLDDANTRIHELESRFDESKYMDYKKIKQDSEQTQRDLEEKNEYYRKIQAEVSDILNGDKVFNFPHTLRLPGSSTLQDLSDDNFIYVCGRTGIPDDLQARLENTASLTTQFNMIYEHLIRYNIINKMIDMIIKNGGLQLTVGYNEENTSGEVYYNLTVEKPEGLVIIKNENEKNEEG